MIKEVEIKATRDTTVLTDEALSFLAKLHREFNYRRLELLEKRVEYQEELNQGIRPNFLEETSSIRKDPNWMVAETPLDIMKRWVEITGPTDRKMVINALNSGANIFMADFEDANTPTWDNMVQGQKNLIDAVNETISLDTPEGKHYQLKPDHAVLFVRPRGWHLEEKHMTVDGVPISGSLFDFGLYFFHNAKNLLEKGSGPYFYLPKLENHFEARLWNDVFVFAQDELGIPQGSIRGTVLIETILAVFEMEEILYELRNHSGGLNAGRWDYIFSIIKKFRRDPNLHLPNRDQISMTVPFMRAYTELLVSTCHKRGAHAIGGMAAFIPNRKDPDVTERALRKVREDKKREIEDGFDGTWIAHPDLLETVLEIFVEALGNKNHQKYKLREDVNVKGEDLLNFQISNGKITEEGIKTNIGVGIKYLSSWLNGRGAVAINNLMEDAATAEISRSQVWQWIQQKEKLSNGTEISQKYVQKCIDEYQNEEGRSLFEKLVFAEHFIEFLTIPAYEQLP